jgi:crotonobetainyl-CoA:carnitine CoA-transferase CaiB-like acyl-CoA transferase
MSGVKVLDLTWHLAGPYATRLLADYGAEIIKIERPLQGDPSRAMEPFIQDQEGIETSILYHYLNTNKRSITLNLKSEEGKKIFLEIVKQVDVVIENFSPDVMHRLELDYSVLSSLNPGLVMTSISNFGTSGPYKNWQASELTTYAMGGAMINTGHPENPPLYIGGHIPSFHVGTVAAAATAISLLGAEKSGIGDHIDLGAFQIWMGAIDRRQSYLMSHQYTGDISSRPWPASAIGTGIWQCIDGYFMTSVGAGLFPRMANMIGASNLLSDDKWATPAARSNPERLDESIALIVPWMLERTKAEARDAAQEHGVYGGPVNDFEDLLHDPHFKHRDFFEEVEHPSVGAITYPGAPFKLHLDNTTDNARVVAPLLGEHTEIVLTDFLGKNSTEIQTLRNGGVI